MIEHIGITGTKNGTTKQQWTRLFSVLSGFRSLTMHHGDCIGVDKQAHEIGKQLGMNIIGHPPSDPKYRAWCAFDVMREPAPYIVRDHAIVDEVQFLIGCPRKDIEELRSGTWATIRYARKQRRNLNCIILIYPDGGIVME